MMASLPESLRSLCKKFQIIEMGVTHEDQALSYDHFYEWVKKDRTFSYLTDERALKRKSLKNVYPSFQEAVVFLFNYQDFSPSYEEEKRLARYVTGFEGLDYHDYCKEALGTIKAELLSLYGEFDSMMFVDTLPILERDLAFRAGLGWIGKNSMLINKSFGSEFMIAGLLLDKKIFAQNMKKKSLETDHCGHCTRCIDACPTQAINHNRTLDTQKCISTYTIEVFKDPELKLRPTGFPHQNGEEVFGCDICQRVCPWNQRSIKLNKSLVHKSANKSDQLDFLLNFFKRDFMTIKNDLERMSNREFRRLFYKTPLSRTGRLGLLKNIKAYLSSSLRK